MAYRAYTVFYRSYPSPYRDFSGTLSNKLPALIGKAKGFFAFDPEPTPPEPPPPEVP